MEKNNNLKEAAQLLYYMVLGIITILAYYNGWVNILRHFHVQPIDFGTFWAIHLGLYTMWLMSPSSQAREDKKEESVVASDLYDSLGSAVVFYGVTLFL